MWGFLFHKFISWVNSWAVAYMDWLEEQSMPVTVSHIFMLIVLGSGLLVGLILGTIWLCGGFNQQIPTIHLQGACQQLYQGIVTKYGMDYSPVNVCP